MLNPMPETILRPLQIGNITIKTPLTLAPMAGQTSYPLRRVVRELGGCGLVCTELISSKALQYKGSRERTFQMFDWSPEDESPFAVQLFGNVPEHMAEAAKIVVDHGADIVDINMGCWVPKVAKKGGGAALLKDVCTAQAVVEAVVNAVDVPVTVKVRSGFEQGEKTAITFAKAAEQVGAAAIAVHARYASQGFGGTADWSVIREVKEAVSNLPVIGNGDVFNAVDAARMIAETGCDGVMIGRASLGAPWIFQYIEYELRTGIALPEPNCAERAAIALRHAHITLETTALPEHVAVRELRGQLSKYALDDPGSKHIRNQLVRVETLADVEAILIPLTT
ncbi:MAG: tRNA dihydrouridine synthase DusB [Chloroflexota bacterium]